MNISMDEIAKLVGLSSIDVVDIDECESFHGESGEIVENDVAIGQCSSILSDVLSNLSDRNAYVIRARQQENRTLEEVGLGLSVCKERARQIEKEAFQEFREALGDYGIHEYSDLL